MTQPIEMSVYADNDIVHIRFGAIEVEYDPTNMPMCWFHHPGIYKENNVRFEVTVLGTINIMVDGHAPNNIVIAIIQGKQLTRLIEIETTLRSDMRSEKIRELEDKVTALQLENAKYQDAANRANAEKLAAPEMITWDQAKRAAIQVLMHHGYGECHPLTTVMKGMNKVQ